MLAATIILACSMESKWFFMHLMARYFPFLMLCALSTSENVPSPFLEIRRYSAKQTRAGDRRQASINYNYGRVSCGPPSVNKLGRPRAGAGPAPRSRDVGPGEWWGAAIRERASGRA